MLDTSSRANFKATAEIDDLDALAKEVCKHLQASAAAAQNFLEHALAAGGALIRAKEQVKHGDRLIHHAHGRKRLPNRRAATSFNVEHNGIRYVATYARFADGGVGELFISTNRAGSSLDECVRDSGVATSLALQHGCSLDTLRGAVLRNVDGSPATALAAAIDEVARILEEPDAAEEE